MKYLALDYGIKRVGVAVSDPEGRMALPSRTMDRSSRDAFFAELGLILEKQGIEAVVVGLPFHDDGSECITTKQVRNFVASFGRRFTQPVYYMEELLSSNEAEADLREAGYSSRQIKQRVDQQAAVRILQSFLDEPENRRTLALPGKN